MQWAYCPFHNSRSSRGNDNAIRHRTTNPREILGSIDYWPSYHLNYSHCYGPRTSSIMGAYPAAFGINDVRWTLSSNHRAGNYGIALLASHGYRLPLPELAASSAICHTARLVRVGAIRGRSDL